MALRELSNEVVSLVHHVELNRAGWWDRAARQLVLASLWLASSPQDRAALVALIETQAGVRIPLQKLDAHLTKLATDGSLVVLPDGRVKLTEAAARGIEERLAAGSMNEAAVRERFAAMVSQSLPHRDAEALWKHFSSGFLIPTIRELGARAYELFSGREARLDGSPRLSDFLKTFPPEDREAVRRVAETFLQPSERAVRSFVLAQMNAHFIVESANLSDRNLDALSRLVGKPPRFNIFVDTNFLFSVLELHENPANDAARSLADLISQLAPRAEIKLYVLPITVDETKRTLIAYRENLRGILLPARLASAADSSELSGIAQRYFSVCKEAKYPISAEQYFEPYIANLIAVLRKRRIELFNVDLGAEKMGQEVIDDIVSELEYEKGRFGRHAKTYEGLEHDVTMWHFVNSKRPARVDSPADAGSWIVTLDFRFLRFDHLKRRGLDGRLPVAVAPAALIQMLQLWLPRTQAFEEAVLNSLRPLLAHEFDPEAERVTIRILSALSRFENAADLSEDTVASVLMNSALRARLDSERDPGVQLELVREAVIEEAERAKAELAKTKAEREHATARVADKERQIADLLVHVKSQGDRIAELGDAFRQESDERQKAQSELERALAASMAKERSRQRRVRLASFCGLAVAALVGLVFAGLWELAPRLATRFSLSDARAEVIVALAAVLVWLLLVELCGRRVEAVKNWGVFEHIHRLRYWFLSLFLVPLVVAAVWAWLSARK